MFQYKLVDNIKADENITIFKYTTQKSDDVHTHEFIEIVYILSGSGEHFVNEVQYSVERGDLLFINFNQTHSFYSEEGMTIVNCLLTPEFISRELVNSENASEILAISSFEDFGSKSLKLMPKVCFRGKTLLEVEALIESMLQEFSKKELGYKTALKGYLHVLITKIFREMRQSDAVIHHMNRIMPEIVKYIEDKCFEKITLNELAEKCFYNPSYLSRIFKECYGKSFMEFVHEKRINEALRLMKETSLSVEDICYSVGYKDKKQFYKLFREHTGKTPNKLRTTL